MNAMSRRVRTYRVMVLLLAAFYFVDRATQETYAWHEFGWQFRYLTIWALTMSLIAAAMMLTRAYGGADRRGAGFVSVTAVVNAIVVASYWRLYFQDPALVNGDKEIVAYRDYYLHLVGPLLQWVDALAIKRAFRRPLGVALWLGVLVVLYLVWAEAAVAPFNDDPVGSAATGLPYPFLNDMAPGGRAIFYGATWASGLVFIILLWAAQRGLDRLLPQKSRSL